MKYRIWKERDWATIDLYSTKQFELEINVYINIQIIRLRQQLPFKKKERLTTPNSGNVRRRNLSSEFT